MGEIVLPVRVMGYPDNDGTEHDSFYIQDADGRHWVWLVRRDDADEIAAALNDHAALQAQVAALMAERDRLREGIAHICALVRSEGFFRDVEWVADELELLLGGNADA